jgi:hypothetical protein
LEMAADNRVKKNGCNENPVTAVLHCRAKPSTTRAQTMHPAPSQT